MIEVRRNRGGYVTAYMEYELKDKHSSFDFCYIANLWVHDRYKDMGNGKWFITKICRKYPSINFVYFVRDKYNDRMSVYEVSRKDGDIKFIKRRIKNGK